MRKENKQESGTSRLPVANTAQAPPLDYEQVFMRAGWILLQIFHIAPVYRHKSQIAVEKLLSRVATSPIDKFPCYVACSHTSGLVKPGLADFQSFLN
jgi:hypothetical protein